MSALIVLMLTAGAAPPTLIAPPPGAKLYALLVGINDYSRARGSGSVGISDTHCAAPTARILGSVLLGQRGRLYADVQITTLCDEEARAAAILSHLRRLADVVRPDDRVVITLSGHGHYEAEPRVTFVSRSGRQYLVSKEYFFTCSDTDTTRPHTLLSDRQLLTAIRRFRGHVLLVMDTCHDGGILPLAPTLLASGPGRYVVCCGAKANEVALEPNGPDPASMVKTSFFMHPILQSLRGDRGPGLLDTMSLFRFANGELPRVFSEARVPKEKWHTPTVYPGDPTKHFAFFRVPARK